MDVLQSVSLDVPGSSTTWLDTGLTLKTGESLRIRATGTIRYSYRNSSLRAYPEGSYESVGEGSNPDHLEEVDRVNVYTPGDADKFPVPNLVPFCLVAVVASSTPDLAANGTLDALRPNRDTTFAPDDLPVNAGSVYLAFNDSRYRDNHGSFSVTVERLGAFDPLRPGRVSPIRLVPVEVFREKQRSVDNTAVCWFIRPKYGPPEGYTEMDIPIECPEIQFETGAADDGSPLYTVLPALAYRPFSGLSITGIPTSVKLGVDAPDVTVIQFDQAKLRREYYEESQVEVFEVPLNGDRSQAMLYLSGVIGNCEGDEESATIELTPWDEVTNLPVGWTLGFECDVGRLPGEEFGTMRCTNLKKLDGIDIADWIRGAQIGAVSSLSRLTVTAHTVSNFAGFESDFPGSHGIIQFVGGSLDGLRRDVGRFDASTGVMGLRRALPSMPEVGAHLIIKAGCDRSFSGSQGCMFWQQGRNFRRTPHLPGRKALRRRIES